MLELENYAIVHSPAKPANEDKKAQRDKIVRDIRRGADVALGLENTGVKLGRNHTDEVLWRRGIDPRERQRLIKRMTWTRVTSNEGYKILFPEVVYELTKDKYKKKSKKVNGG